MVAYQRHTPMLCWDCGKEFTAANERVKAETVTCPCCKSKNVDFNE